MSVRIFSCIYLLVALTSTWAASAGPADHSLYPQDKQTIESALVAYREQTSPGGRSSVIRNLRNLVSIVIEGDESARTVRQRLELRMFQSLLFPAIDSIVQENTPCSEAISVMQNKTGARSENPTINHESYGLAVQFVNLLCESRR